MKNVQCVWYRADWHSIKTILIHVFYGQLTRDLPTLTSYSPKHTRVVEHRANWPGSVPPLADYPVSQLWPWCFWALRPEWGLLSSDYIRATWNHLGLVCVTHNTHVIHTHNNLSISMFISSSRYYHIEWIFISFWSNNQKSTKVTLKIETNWKVQSNTITKSKSLEWSPDNSSQKS